MHDELNSHRNENEMVFLSSADGFHVVKAVVTNMIRLRFHGDSTAVRLPFALRPFEEVAYVTTVDLPVVGCCTAA